MTWQIIPNIITCLRVLLVPPTIWAMLTANYQLAFALFVVSGCSDGLDGLLARRYGWITRFGSIMDPLADKVLLVSSYIALAVMGQIPSLLAAIVVFRDLWIVGGFAAYYFSLGEPHFAPSLISKLNTVVQILLIVFILFNLSIYPLPQLSIIGLSYLVFATTLLSLLDYTWVWGRRAYFELKSL